MGKNDGFTAFMVGTILFTILVSTGIKIYHRHLDSEYRVIEKTICESARECYLDEKCSGSYVSLGKLIENKYLEPQVNPKSKEYISKDTPVYYNSNTCVINIR